MKLGWATRSAAALACLLAVARFPASASSAPGRDNRVEALVRAAAKPPAEVATGEIEKLLAAGAPINGYTPRRETPLQAAASAGNDAVISLLLARGAAIDGVSARGATALGWAARNGHESTVRLLLDSGAGIDAASEPERSPISLAASRGQAAIVHLLLDRGAKLDKDADIAGSVLGAVAASGDAELAAIVLPRLAGLFASSPAFRVKAADAAVVGSDAFFNTFVEQMGPASKRREFDTLLLAAAIANTRREAVAAAIGRGADVNAADARYGTLLALAAGKRDRNIVVLLLSAGADAKALDEAHAKLLWDLAGDVIYERKTVQLLARIGAMDAKDADGQTLLFRAAARGDDVAVQALLAMHADPAKTVERWKGDKGWTPLMIAAAEGQTGVVKELLAAGALVDQVNAHGRTALAFAAWYGRSSVIEALLAAGADPDAADDNGQTPRTLALAAGEQKIVRLLGR